MSSIRMHRAPRGRTYDLSIDKTTAMYSGYCIV